MTRHTYLQTLVKQLTPPDDFLEVKFIPFRGWFLCGELRWFEDSGEDYIGRNWREAEALLTRVFKRS